MQIEWILKVLGEPTRFRIYQSLMERKHCVRSLSKKLGITESAVSQHLKQMKEAGLVYSEKYGYHTHFLPSEEGVDFLAESFAALQAASRNLDRSVKPCQCEYRKEEGI